MENLDHARSEEIVRALTLGNLGVIAPHKMKFFNRYDMDWLINATASGKHFKFVTFWKADEGEENRCFSQWYRNRPFQINGRSYITAEQYMMSEKALLFRDYKMYDAIMREPDPKKCKAMGKRVLGFDQAVWDNSFREILWHGNLGKLQSDLEIVDALLSTGDAVLVEASPFDDIYGAGLTKSQLLNPDGSLKVPPQDWHKAGSTTQAQNNLGFVLMALRDLFNQLMGVSTN